jgi:hypothetical protein
MIIKRRCVRKKSFLSSESPKKTTEKRHKQQKKAAKNTKKADSLSTFSLFSLFSLSALTVGGGALFLPLLPLLLLLVVVLFLLSRCRLEPKVGLAVDATTKEEHDGRSRRWRNPIDDDRRKEKERGRRNDGVIYGRANESVPRAASISALARGRHRAVHALALALEDLDELPERALRERD